MPAYVTIGSVTSHGGQITQGDSMLPIDGKAVHLVGMTHMCPKCKVTSVAVTGDPLFIVNGKAAVPMGATASCGAQYQASQSIAIQG
jgi:uncharacterized Zn-binding protein involved in type VI secretion